jgi:hypothetical protein
LTTTNCSKYPDLGAGYKLISEGKYDLSLLDSMNNIIVSPHILEYVYDTCYIVISQRPWHLVVKVQEMDYKESFEAFEGSSFHQYWIIDKMEENIYTYDSIEMRGSYSNVYGPYTREKYEYMTKWLDLPKELILN